MALFVDLVALSNGLHGSVQMDLVALFSWIGWLRYRGILSQCTWFAWGRFYELYGYDPGFTGNGWDCVDELLQAHPDKFERSTTPPKQELYSLVLVKTMLV